MMLHSLPLRTIIQYIYFPNQVLATTYIFKRLKKNTQQRMNKWVLEQYTRSIHPILKQFHKINNIIIHRIKPKRSLAYFTLQLYSELLLVIFMYHKFFQCHKYMWIKIESTKIHFLLKVNKTNVYILRFLCRNYFQGMQFTCLKYFNCY